MRQRETETEAERGKINKVRLRKKKVGDTEMEEMTRVPVRESDFSTYQKKKDNLDLALTLCSAILSESHLSSLRYSLRDAKQARSTTNA